MKNKKSDKVKKKQPNAYFQQYMSQRRTAGRDVGAHPHTARLKDKKKYKFKLELFLKREFSEKFTRLFSTDQKKFIKEIQETILNGGQYCIAMPRGEGKTTIIIGAIVWAACYGHRGYVVIIGSDQAAAEKVLAGVKTTLETSNKMMELFPEVCFYIKALDGLSQRAAGQLSNNRPTRIEWRADGVRFAYIEIDPAYLEVGAGVAIEARGLTGRLRGLQITLPNGSVIRPDFVFSDDPQTRESATSMAQCEERENLILSDVMGLSGVGVELAILMAGTVIGQNDLIERICSKWRSVRAKALYEFPDEHNPKNRHGLWQEYIDLRRQARKEGAEKKVCNDFYRKNRKEMDKGAVVGNPHRKSKNELSALQNIYNYISDNGENSFYSELQNEPQGAGAKFYSISSSMVLSRLNGFERNAVPGDCHYINAGIDVNHYALNWAVSAMQNDMTSFGIDYGRYPKGGDIWNPESEKTTEQAIYDGVIELSGALLVRQPAIKLVGIDGNYATDTIYRVVDFLNRKYSNVRFLVFRGFGSEKYNLPQNSKTVIRKGHECHWEKKEKRGEHVIFNSHYWHMWLQKSFLLNPGFPGSYSFWGDNNTDHRTIADHIIADKLIELEYKNGKELMKWSKRPGARNDLADAVKITVVGASVFGAEVKGREVEIATKNEIIRNTSISFIQI